MNPESTEMLNCRILGSHVLSTFGYKKGDTMSEETIKFTSFGPDNTLGPIRVIRLSDIGKCPHYIMMPEHYRADRSCRCNDVTHKDMADWGYVWDGTRWVAGEDGLDA